MHRRVKAVLLYLSDPSDPVTGRLATPSGVPGSALVPMSRAPRRDDAGEPGRAAC